MHAAIIHSYDRPPAYGEFREVDPQPGEEVITVSAAAVSQLTRSRASGHHYSGGGDLPNVPGVDGVGRDADGRRVYFVLPRPPFGAMAERSVVRAGTTVPVPDDVDDTLAAAIANPGMSSWAALTRRARLQRGETVLVNGATGTSGSLAVAIARHLGAGRVVATGRDRAKLAAIGADVAIPLDEHAPGALAEAMAAGVDVVLDYLWGPPAEQVIAAAAPHPRRLRFVAIGSMAGPTAPIPSAALRSSGLELMGSGIGSVSRQDLVASIGELLAAVRPAGLAVAVETAPLSDVGSAWSRDTGDRRLVLTIGG